MTAASISYLIEVDAMLERAKEVTRNGRYTYLEYARYADDLVILVDGYRQHDWLLRAAHQRLREEINPVLRGWVAYFRIGHTSRCFAFVKLWVEQKVRRHMMRARNRGGFGWTRWSTAWLHEALGLFGDYRVQYRANA